MLLHFFVDFIDEENPEGYNLLILTWFIICPFKEVCQVVFMFTRISMLALSKVKHHAGVIAVIVLVYLMWCM